MLNDQPLFSSLTITAVTVSLETFSRNYLYVRAALEELEGLKQQDKNSKLYLLLRLYILNRLRC